MKFEYNSSSDLTGITDPKGSKFKYEYDGKHNVVKGTSAMGVVNRLQYDGNGNITRSGTVDPNAQDKGVWISRTFTTDKNHVASVTDAEGNITRYGWTLGRKLAGVSNGKNIRDHTGARTKKTVDGVTTEYNMAGDLLMSETTSRQTLWYTYDSNASLLSIVSGGKHYFYQRNLQNDVIGLIDENGDTVVEYTYDSWGRVLSITGSMKDTLGQQNPFRYRGYYYDRETGLYCVSSRYYDPEIGRFISADTTDVLDVQDDLYDKNLYAYCDNNPVVRIDSSGEVWHLAIGAVVGVATQFIADVGIGLAAGSSFGEVISSLSPVDYISAAVGGMIAASGIGTIGAIATTATLGGATYVANCSYKGVKATKKDFIASTVIGGASGANGKNMRGVYSRSKQVIKSTKSARKKAMYTAKTTTIKKNIVKSTGRTFLAGIASNVSNFFRKWFTKSKV